MTVPEYLPDFRPSHVVPRDGLAAWEAPDPGRPTLPLDPFLPVELVERSGDWGRVLCSNGWTAWVDARLLVAVPADPPASGSPLARTADPRPLIARAEDALGRYRRATEELAAGRASGETFRLRTRGLRVGMVVDGESVWLYDAEHERWAYCDGRGLSTYAASAAPVAAGLPEPGPEPAGGSPGAAAPERTGGRGEGGHGRDAHGRDAHEGDGHEGDGHEGDGHGGDGHGGDGELGAPAPPAYEPTRVVPRIDPPAAAGPPPTQVVDRPPPGPEGEGR